ncbi:hypothetical protein FVR03_15505 [Pontibacter qinzhouensis]|uniref:DUF2938 domain-containing protein n=1 Tax=Pontibacter qinzhouensis TaxID=2603253 RepID=A0A5C8JLB3_9BACT|nr:hypothetical protein [Pontibacter qinzhouensis]TXK37414.1 hypothetical protein FVR03_15505 [Pontibacter qinzhouensis]
MKLLYISLAGLAATAAMTAFMYLLTVLTKRVMKMIKILGTMLTNQTQPDGSLSGSIRASVTGTVVHYAIGILFAIGYLALWDSGVGAPTAAWGFLLGLGHGLLAMAGWYFYFMLHPQPPLIALRPFLLSLIFAHTVFGIVASYVFYLLAHPAHSFWR